MLQVRECAALNEADGTGAKARGGGAFILGRVELIGTRVSSCQATSTSAISAPWGRGARARTCPSIPRTRANQAHGQ